MPRCHQPRLAQELIDIIIDYFYADGRVLGVCGLVCKAWVSSSRYHLFSQLSLDSGSVKSIFQLLDSHRSTIPLATRELKLEGEFKPGEEHITWTTVINLLSELRSIHIDVVDVITWTEDDTIIGPGWLITALSNCKFPPHLEKLVFRIVLINARDFDSVEWPEMDDILARLETSGVKIHFEVEGHNDNTEEIKKRLFKCHQRDLLRFQFPR